MTLPVDLRAWTKQLLKHYDFSAGQKMGQHFLVDNKVLSEIIKVSKLQKLEKVLEVGGGLGVLTIALLDEGVDLTTVELDTKLVSGLEKFQSLSPHFKIVNADIIKLSDEALIKLMGLDLKSGFSIISNLPYEISGAFLKKFLDSTLPIRQLVLLLQLEVAERLVARPGQMSLIGVLANLNSRVEIIKKINPSSFMPPPRVTSALVKIVPLTKKEKSDLLSGQDEKSIWRLCRIGFSAKRKQLSGNLSSALSLTKIEVKEILTNIGLNSEIRAQDLSISDWVNLSKKIF